MIFSSENNTVYGNNSCNNFSGSYTLDSFKIELAKVATTLKACPDMATEKQLMAVLEKVDNYSLKGNKMAPLAIFEVM
ncbi:META domain-containing protein [Lacinutrix undariae]